MRKPRKTKNLVENETLLLSKDWCEFFKMLWRKCSDSGKGEMG